ncbi:circularly permuted type 2 ATP-grasp protein [Halopseudomonas pachastrellae]|uniref:circularly permuted type 2 ATP-grasp protein n=1 Tax=Halopseudomonas pachastrellae TaxID=254161 RepID=UPI003D7E4A54
MQQAVNLGSAVKAILGEYAGHAGHDELLGEDQQPRAPWQALLEDVARLGPDVLAGRWEETQNLLHENGVTFNPYEDDPGQLRSWQLDCLPWVVGTQEWDELEAGLRQRSRLLEHILDDLYGARRIISEGLLPPELIFTHPGFLFSAADDPPQVERPLLIFHGTDLVRDSQGGWQVLADWTQSPAGAGYALENRITLARALPSIYREAPIKRLAGFLQAQHRCLASLANGQREQPNIVLLSPGPGSPGYFEHAWLANYMNFSLVEGDDLVVRDGQVAMRTLGGLKQVDVILRQINDPWCDPLELRPDSLLGVPGLLQAARCGNVHIANALGAGILEHPGLSAFLPALCEALLGEELLLPCRETLWCGEPRSLEQVKTEIDGWILRDISKPGRLYHADQMGLEALRDLRISMERHPYLFTAQRPVEAAVTPGFNPQTGTLERQNATLRFFSLVEPDDLTKPVNERNYRVMPGGLAWVGEPGAPLMKSRLVKDIWVMAPVPQPHISLLRQALGPIVVTRDGKDLPCRVAESLFWMGRYGERLDTRGRLLREALARLLQDDRQESGSQLMPDLLRALEIPLDPAELEEETPASSRFSREYIATRDRLLQLFADDLPDGLPVLFGHFVRNSRAVRDHLGDDTWRAINSLRQHFNSMSRTRGVVVGQRHLEAMVLDLAAFFGLCNETMPHHYGWRFLDIGRFLERALGSLELLKLALLTADEPGIPLWEVVLATTDNLTVYRRRYRSQLHPLAILDLLLFDEANPRSIGYMLKRLGSQIAKLPSPGSSPYRNQEQRLIIQATSALHLVDIETLADLEGSASAREALNNLLDQLIQPMAELSNAITHSHFSHVEAPRQLVSMHYSGQA